MAAVPVFVEEGTQKSTPAAITGIIMKTRRLRDLLLDVSRETVSQRLSIDQLISWQRCFVYCSVKVTTVCRVTVGQLAVTYWMRAAMWWSARASLRTAESSSESYMAK